MYYILIKYCRLNQRFMIVIGCPGSYFISGPLWITLTHAQSPLPLFLLPQKDHIYTHQDD